MLRTTLDFVCLCQEIKNYYTPELAFLIILGLAERTNTPIPMVIEWLKSGQPDWRELANLFEAGSISAASEQ